MISGELYAFVSFPCFHKAMSQISGTVSQLIKVGFAAMSLWLTSCSGDLEDSGLSTLEGGEWGEVTSIEH